MIYKQKIKIFPTGSYCIKLNKFIETKKEVEELINIKIIKKNDIKNN